MPLQPIHPEEFLEVQALADWAEHRAQKLTSELPSDYVNRFLKERQMLGVMAMGPDTGAAQNPVPIAA